MQKNVFHILLAALAGIAVFLILLFALKIPEHIVTGNQGQIAIQMLDAMRQPMLAIEKIQTGNALTGDKRRQMQAAAAVLRERVTRYLEVAAYNPLLLARVRQFATVVDKWLQGELHFAGHRHGGADTNLDPEAMHQLVLRHDANMQAFIHALEILALGEKPIHHDIGGGRHATYTLQVMAAGLVLYLLGLIIVYQRQSRQRLHAAYGNLQRAQQSLSEREQYLALTLDSIGDAVIATDADGLVVRMNPVAEQLTGWTSEAARGQPLPAVFHIINARTRERVDNPVEKVLRTGQIVGLANHTLLVSRDGKEYQIADSGAPIREPDGRILGVILVFRDVTEAYRLQAELEASRDALEQRVAERTQELEAFSYAVSHDLRAPLRSIHGFSLALQDDCREQLDPQCRDYLQRICNAVVHMGELIDAMLALSRITRKDIQRDEVDLTRLARAVITDLEQANPDRPVAWEVAEDLRCTGDAELLRIVLENLLGNALKYSAGGDRQPRIEIGGEMQAGQRVFHVRDNGCGFDARYADKLFAPFQRLHGREYEGLGIGLATVKRIIERHAGRIWAEGRPGEGATFYFTLPA